MVADSEVSPEPQSLEDGLSASQREPPSSPADDPVSVSAGIVPQISQLEDTASDVGAPQMRVTVEINLALWGMILCAAMQTGQRFTVY
jgi:hypothetical protein